MKPSHLLLSLAFSGFLCAPAAFSDPQFGMDQDYQQQVQEQHMQHMQQQAQGPAFNSSAAGNTQAYHTTDSAWSDMGYVGNQYAPLGNVQAPIMNSGLGAISTFAGNNGQYLKGSMLSGQSLPKTQMGLNAINGGYFNDAAGRWGSGGFYGWGGGSKKYPLLPPTSTTPVQLDTAF